MSTFIYALGVTPLVGYTRFRADGLSSFCITETDYDSAFGYGARIGVTAKPLDMLSIGAAYSTRIYSSKLKKYETLFAEQGGFDIPANVNAGVAVKPINGLDITFDYAHIFYNSINSIANPGSRPFTMGSDNGPGFG